MFDSVLCRAESDYRLAELDYHRAESDYHRVESNSIKQNQTSIKQKIWGSSDLILVEKTKPSVEQNQTSQAKLLISAIKF